MQPAFRSIFRYHSLSPFVSRPAALAPASRVAKASRTPVARFTCTFCDVDFPIDQTEGSGYCQRARFLNELRQRTTTLGSAPTTSARHWSSRLPPRDFLLPPKVADLIVTSGSDFAKADFAGTSGWVIYTKGIRQHRCRTRGRRRNLSTLEGLHYAFVLATPRCPR